MTMTATKQCTGLGFNILFLDSFKQFGGEVILKRETMRGTHITRTNRENNLSAKFNLLYTQKWLSTKVRLIRAFRKIRKIRSWLAVRVFFITDGGQKYIVPQAPHINKIYMYLICFIQYYVKDCQNPLDYDSSFRSKNHQALGQLSTHWPTVKMSMTFMTHSHFLQCGCSSKWMYMNCNISQTASQKEI